MVAGGEEHMGNGPGKGDSMDKELELVSDSLSSGFSPSKLHTFL